MTAPVADIENRLIALAVAMCDARVHVSGSSGEATGAVLVCTRERHHDGLHHDEWDHIRWEQDEEEPEKGDRHALQRLQVDGEEDCRQRQRWHQGTLALRPYIADRRGQGD